MSLHLARGLLGAGLLIGGLVGALIVSPVLLAGVPAGLLALRGCPSCWVVELVELASRGRLQRQCRDGACVLVHPEPGRR